MLTEGVGPLRKAWYHHRGFQILLTSLVSLACLAFAVRDLWDDPQAMQQMQTAFSQANYVTLPVLWLCIAVFYWLKAWRWRLLLKPVGDFHTTRDLIPPTMIGFAFNNLLPAHIGDFVRVYFFSRKTGVPFTAVLSSAVLERVFDVIAILGFLGLGLVFVPGMDETVRRNALIVAGLAVFAVSCGLIYVFWTRPFVALFEAVLARLPFVPAGLRGKLCRMLESGATGLQALKSPRLIVGILGSSFIQWAINGLQMHISLWSFGVEVSPLVSCILLGVTAFGVTIPSSPGYFGVIQLCFMLVLKYFVDDPAAVFGASIYFHLSQYIPVTLVGLYYFNATGLTMAQMEATAEEVETRNAERGVRSDMGDV